MRLRKKIIIIIIFLFFILLLLYKLFQPSHSQAIVSYLETSNISQISIEKSIDSGMSFLAEPIFLTNEEKEKFYIILGNMELINKKTAPIPLKSSIVYYVKFIDDKDQEIASLEFHGSEILHFVFSSKNQPTIYKRFEIVNTDTTVFFEKVFQCVDE